MKNTLLAFCLTAALCLVRPIYADEAATQLQSLVDKVAPDIVTVKVVMKTATNFGGQSQNQESKMDLPGVVVDKDGIIMISNMVFSPSRYMSMLGRGGGDAGDFKVTPTDFKVLFDQDDKEYTAFLAATDTKLDLAFIKIENLGDKKLTPVDFGSTAQASIGQQVVSVNRLHKGYDNAPYFETTRISGLVSKPRKAYLLDGGPSGLGLPIFALTGEPLGVLTTLESGIKDDSLTEGISFSIYTHQFIGGSSGLLRTFIVPSQTVNGVIGQAKIRAVEVAAERAKKKTEAPAKSDSKPPAKSTGKEPPKKQ